MDVAKLIDDKLIELQPLYDRMDETELLLHWDDTPYKLLKGDNVTEIKDAISVTPNSPKTFADNVISDLQQGAWQTVVEGKGLKKRDTAAIEAFIDDGFAEIDELQRKNGEPGLNEVMASHVCTRGVVAVFYLAQTINGKFTLEAYPCDARYLPFEMGEWVCYRTFKSRAYIDSKYKHLLGSNQIPEKYGNLIECRDWWSNDRHEFFIGDERILEESHRLGEYPYIISLCSSGFMHKGTVYQKHIAEDILFLNRGLYKEQARTLSLEQTAGYASVFPGYEYETDVDGAPAIPSPQLDQTLPVRKGERHVPVPRGEVGNSFMTARDDLDRLIQKGGPTTPKDYNTPPSAIAITQETALITKIQFPRKKTMEAAREQLACKMVKQARLINGQITIGKRGSRNSYSPSELPDEEDYSIGCNLMTQNKSQEIANLSLYLAGFQKLPQEFLLKEILKVQEPEAIMRQLALEKAHQADPALDLFDMALRYAEEAESLEDETEKGVRNFQSQMLVSAGVRMVKQRLQPAPLAPPAGGTSLVEPAKGNPNALNALPALARLGGLT